MNETRLIDEGNDEDFGVAEYDFGARPQSARAAALQARLRAEAKARLAKGATSINKPRIRYFEQEDILHLVIAEGTESRSLELSPNITVELNDQNELLGVEILHASSFLRDVVVESIQAKTLQLLEAQPA
jgi:uncharacterized protein YuzE